MLLVVVLTSSLAPVADAGVPSVQAAVVQPEAGATLWLEGRWMRASTMVGLSGIDRPIPTLNEYQVVLGGRVGILDWVTVEARLPLLNRLTSNRQVGEDTGAIISEGAANTFVGDAELGGRIKVFERWGGVLSAGLTLGVPSGDGRDRAGLVTGDGELNVLGDVGIAWSFAPWPGYVSGTAAFNKRSNDYSDELRLRFEAGWGFFDLLTLRGRVEGVLSLDNGSRVPHPTQRGLHADRQSWVMFAPELEVHIAAGLGLYATAELLLSGRNVPNGPTFALGLSARL